MPILSKPKPLFHGGPTREQLTAPGSPWRIPADLVDEYCAMAADPGAYADALTGVNSASDDAKLTRRTQLRAIAWANTGRPLPTVLGADDGGWPPGVTDSTFALHDHFLMAADRAATVRRRAAEQAERHRRMRTCAACGEVRGDTRSATLAALPDSTRPVQLCRACRPVVEQAVTAARAVEKVNRRARADLAATLAADLIRAADQADKAAGLS